MDKKLLYTLIFSVSWALNIFVRKLALNGGVSPLPFLFESSMVSVTVLTIYIAIKKRKDLSVFSSQKVFKQFLLMGMLIGAAWVFDTFGLTLTSSINYSFIIKSGLVFSILFAFIFFHEKLTKSKIIIILILLGGAYLITTGGNSLVPIKGDLIVIFASFFYSAATIVQKYLTKKVDPEVIGWGRVVSGMLILLLWLIVTKQPAFTNGYCLYILLAGILLSFTTVFINKALAVSSVSYLTIMTMTVPLINALLGIVFLDEIMNAYQIAGGIMILISGVVVNIKKQIVLDLC
jgi:O-acetylserine/cysteine efflux transporter